MTPDNRSEHWNYGILLCQGTSNSAGYRLTSERLVLPFLYSTLGAPIFFAGLLLPIATVSKLVIQIFAAPVIRAARRNKWFIAISALIWALSLVLVTTVVGGVATRWVIPVFVLVSVVLGAARGLNSLATQNLVGQILPHHQRRKLLFTQASLSGLFAMAVALASQFVLPPQTSNAAHLELIWLGIGLIVLSALMAIAIREPAHGAGPVGNGSKIRTQRPIGDLRKSFQVAFTLPWFRQFLIARALFLSIELGTPFFAVHAASFHASNPAGLSTFVIASSLGLVVGGIMWPRIFKESMRFILVIGAGIACLGGLLAMTIELGISPQGIYVYAVVFVLISLGSQAISNGRTLYLMNVTTDEQRPICIAVANVTIGFASIAFGAGLGALAGYRGVAWPIFVLIILNLAAALFALRLKGVKPASV